MRLNSLVASSLPIHSCKPAVSPALTVCHGVDFEIVIYS